MKIKDYFFNNLDIHQEKYKTSLIKLGNHNVLAIIALISIGSATRVMEAGLACPDWPLCYGNLFPLPHMNIKVFLEWFHRLDAFFVGIALLVQLLIGWHWRKELPKWLPSVYLSLVLLVTFQGGLGALTVFQLLPAGIVTTHLALALILLAVMSGLSQFLLADAKLYSPIWWRVACGSTLMLVFSQS